MAQYYPLTLEDAIAKYTNGDITAKGLLHFYILIKCKPGWKLKLDQKTIADELGIQKSAFYGAISRLRQEGSIDWEAPKGIVVSLSISSSFRQCGKESTIAESESTIAESESTIVESESTFAETKSLEPLLNKASGDSPYFYHLFTKSLSDSERENFWEFGRKKAAQLPKPPQLPEKWIAANWKELRSQWVVQLSPAQKAAADEERWANDPHRDEWISEIRIGKPRWIAQGDQSLTRDERKAFAEWADANGLIWGAES
jgi:hypothetical protein